MKLTVDASMVIKWFVAEPMSDEARLPLARRIYLQAPEFLLVEFANTIWKKGRRGELPDAQPYLEELAGLSDIITLHPDGDLIERAAQIALEMDHPIYDCLYLACAETTDSDLITADKSFVDKAVDRLPGARVRYICAAGVANWIETVGDRPSHRTREGRDADRRLRCLCENGAVRSRQSLPRNRGAAFRETR